MSIAEYESKFSAFSHFALNIIKTEESKCRRFQKGLEYSIRLPLTAYHANTFVELVNMARRVEKEVKEKFENDGKEKQNQSESHKKSKYKAGQTSKYIGNFSRNSQKMQPFRSHNVNRAGRTF